MYFHWQNLNDKPCGRHGSGVLHGRSWWRIGRDSAPGGGASVNCEWHLFANRCAISFSARQGDGVGVQFSIAIPLLLTLYLTLEGGIFARIAKALLPAKGYADRELSLRIQDWSIWWQTWVDPDSWSSKTPKWRNGNWHPLDTFLGKSKYSRRELNSAEASIPMPERAYRATVTLCEDTWKRPRWFARRLLRADIDCKADPIPHPGKGESEYDCGQDATYGLTCTAATPEEAIATLVESVLRSRRRHGGSVLWKPEAAA